MCVDIHTHTHKRDTYADVSYTERKHLRPPPQRFRKPGAVMMTREQVGVCVCVCVCVSVSVSVFCVSITNRYAYYPSETHKQNF